MESIYFTYICVQRCDTMRVIIHKNFVLFALLFMLIPYKATAQSYYMPAESDRHEGTWLQWPHQYEYGMMFRNSLDDTWVAMTKALVGGEKVFIIAYDDVEKDRITSLLTAANVPLTEITFFIYPTNDVWVRDSGPIYVKDQSGQLHIEDWGFNGWGGKYNYDLCNPIPSYLGESLNTPIIDLNSIMVNEGGAVEMDGKGVLLACKSSIINQSQPNAIRNPGMTQTQAEEIFSKYLGATKFIWLEGNVGDPYDVTDFHIDGFAKFFDDKTMVTMNQSDLSYWGASTSDITKLYNASNVENIPYKKVYLPLTKNNVRTTNGVNLESKGSYVNYYVANEVVLFPTYNDLNDEVAKSILQTLYTDKTIIGIDCRNLYEWGGMVHCVTQQQPIGATVGLENSHTLEDNRIQNFPNPFDQFTSVIMELKTSSEVSIIIYNADGKEVSKQYKSMLNAGKHVLNIDAHSLPSGVYHYTIVTNKSILGSGCMVVTKD